MIFTRLSRKHTEKVSSDDVVLSFDLLSNLTYMAALASAGISRDMVFEWAIKQNYKTGIYFHQIYTLAKRLGFEYVHAFQMVSKRAKAETIKSLLLRFASAIGSGSSEADFLKEEARVQRDQYISSYHRNVETLAKWGDAYAALLVSVSLVVVVAMISMMLSNMGSSFVVLLTVSTILMTAFGCYIIYRTAPYEIKTYQNRRGPRERYLAVRLLFICLPIGVVLALILGFTAGLGFSLLLIGLVLLPSGFLAWRDNNRVDKLNQQVAGFIRGLGNTAASLGSTLAVALGKLDRRSMGTLEPYVQRLQTRLNGHLSADKSWDAFRDEIGSELMNRTSRMLVDGTALGGDPGEVGAIAADYAMDAALLQARRKVTALPFAYMTVPLHFAMTALIIFILEIMKVFNQQIGTATQMLESQSDGQSLSVLPALPIFQSQDMGMMSNLTLASVLSLTIANALAPKFALGGHTLNIALFGAITCIMSGLNMLIIPAIAARLLLTGSSL